MEYDELCDLIDNQTVCNTISMFSLELEMLPPDAKTNHSRRSINGLLGAWKIDILKGGIYDINEHTTFKELKSSDMELYSQFTKIIYKGHEEFGVVP